MDKEKSIDVLNTLIEINNDRIEGYDTASRETKEHDLKNLFSQLGHTSQVCREELINEVRSLGGTPVEGTRTTGKFFRMWMDVKAALTGNDRKEILDSCEFGEDTALETYQKEIRDNLSEMSAAHLTMLNKQYILIKADHDKIKHLRDVLVEH